jgi:ceramide glucosyltransferase
MLTLLQALPVIAALFGIFYCLLSFRAMVRFRSRGRRTLNRDFTPPVSILKPLCGLDPHGYESLRSHCVQDYPEYEIVFGISVPDDPAAAAVNDLIQEYPDIQIRLVVCPHVFGMNFKVSNLLQMLPEVRYEYLVINDSDIAVPSDYLRRVIGPLEDRSVGIVTCLYRGVAAHSFGSRLESMTIESDFVPGVLCANELENGIRFAMGSTMAFRRDVLPRIGGLQSIADYLADDYELGQRISNAGLRVEIADCVVDHYLPEYSIAGLFQHQLRWARTVRSCRPHGYAGMIVTFAFPWSIFALATSPSMILASTVVMIALALRITVTVASARFVLSDRRILENLWLIPVRDFFALLIWILSYMGTHVVWRGNKFELANGKLRPA